MSRKRHKRQRAIAQSRTQRTQRSSDRRRKRNETRELKEMRSEYTSQQKGKPGYKNVTLEPRTDTQKLLIQSIYHNDITFATGPAGTGKTHVAIGMAVQMIRAGALDKLYLARPLVSVGKDMGYLPGDIDAKVGPYMVPCFDELNYYLSVEMIKQWQAEKIIEIVPLSMLRGRTLKNAFIILDEAQNADRSEVKTLLTRIGENSRLVMTGDPVQNDLYRIEETCALCEAAARLKGMYGFNHIEFDIDDIVRHRLIGEIIDRLW